MEMTKAEKLKQYRLSEAEFQMICDLLGREPQGLEWALFSAMWSEHCSYKSSKVHLKKLFGSSKRVLQSFGENAGIVDLGDGEKVAFKMESHNHPSFIEPYQGAATGVGGILRDIFTMGARPVALANYLCFGEPQAPRMQTLVNGVVHGIGGYGNCVGVPTVTGQTHFDASYNENILVNAMAVGYFGKNDPICLSQAKGVGNHVVYVGAKTGRDGIHGASMASESFDDNSAAKRPTVQIGDPFYEKLLIEACLEVMKKNLVVAIQDMGAAGLTSSTFEMAEKGGVGIEMDLSLVPLRDSTLTPEDIMLSESQERMLLVCEPQNFKALKAEFDKWGLDACVVGRVTEDQKVRLLWNSEVICETLPETIVSSAPQYERAYDAHNLNFSSVKEIPQAQESDLKDALKTVLQSVHGGDRSWIYNQYDQRVGAATAKDCSQAIGVVRLKESHRGLGVVLGCRPHVMRMDPYWGGMDSVAHPALQLAVHGFEPLAVTDCLNFGNPEKKETMTQFVAALDGMNTLCKRLDTPIISGNVSFYNETKNKNICPTPSTGLVGLRPSVQSLASDTFVEGAQDVVLITFGRSWHTGFYSEMQKQTADGYFDSKMEGFEAFVKQLQVVSNKNRFSSARVVGKMGLLYALARMSLNGVGCKVETSQAPFTEVFYQVVVTTTQWSELSQELSLKNVTVQKIGTTTPGELSWNRSSWTVDELKSYYKNGWEASFAQLAR